MSIGARHIGSRRSPPGEEESHPQSQAEDKIGTLVSERPTSAAPHMDEKVVAVFKGVAEILSTAREVVSYPDLIPTAADGLHHRYVRVRVWVRD